MKKTGMIWLIALMCMFFSVNVWADISDKKTEPDIKTDYYMIVESKQGGIDIYAHPDLESSKLNEELISNGTALHIEGEEMCIRDRAIPLSEDWESVEEPERKTIAWQSMDCLF